MSASLAWRLRAQGEPSRVCRRLQLLRGWSHDKQDDEWLATDEGKQATMFEPTLVSRWGETGHA